jgi:hypothetical protein
MVRQRVPKFKVTAVTACLLLAAACGTGTTQTPGGTPAPSQANTMKTPDEAARKVLESLPQLVTEANYKSMGFASLDEVRSAQLGVSVPRRTVSYQQLLNYQPGAPLRSLFASEEQMVYAIQAAQQVRTTAIVSRRGDSWQISSVGDGYLANLFSTAGTNFEIISIPGLNLEFAGVREGEEFTLIPAQDYPQLQFTRGTRIPSAKALPLIVAHAREFDKQYGEEIRRRRLVK